MSKVYPAMNALFRAYSHEQVEKSVTISGPPANLVRRALTIEARAEIYAERHGYVGVGVISIQQFQLDKWLRRTGVEIYS